jgi:lipid-A-disaccharide synthase
VKNQKTIMLLAGEASGDKRAAELVEALKRLSPETRFSFFGSGGDQMRREGVEVLADIRDTAIIGPVEIVRALGKLRLIYSKLLQAARERRPDLVILVDWPEFNLRIVKDLKRLGLTTIYYISPQLWAWRRYRVRIVRRYVDKMIVILPFEVEFYRQQGIAVEFVGHPLVDSVRATLDRTAFCRKHGLASDPPIVSLLPGSRRTEVVHILPVLVEAASRVSQRLNVQFVIPLAPTISLELARSIIERARSVPVRVIQGDTYNALAHSELAVVTSGTATLEAALLGTPLIVVYRARAVNYWLIRPLIHLDTFGMVNLIAGERVAPELIQRDFTPEKLSAAMLELLSDESKRTAMKEKLSEVCKRLGEGGAAERAAEVVLAFLD